MYDYSIKLIDNIVDYNNTINKLKTSLALAIDIETYVLPEYKGAIQTALQPHGCSISTIQLKSENDPIVYVYDLITLEQQDNYDRETMLELLLATKQLIAQNASFETKFLKKYYGVLLHNFWCTRVASQLINNALGNKFTQTASGNSLANIVKDYLSIEISGKGAEQVTDWYPRPLSQNKLEYAAVDVIYLFELKKILEEIITTKFLEYYDDEQTGDFGLGMEEVLELEMEFIAVEAECEYNGLPINIEATKLFEETIEDTGRQGAKLKVAGELCKEIGFSTYRPIDLDYIIPDPKALRALNSPKQLVPIISKFIGPIDSAEAKQVERMAVLLDQLYKQGEARFISDDEAQYYEEFENLHKEDIFNRNKVARLLVEYKKLAKQASMRISKYIHPLTNRIHYRLNSLGASTGRCSSSSPWLMC